MSIGLWDEREAARRMATRVERDSPRTNAEPRPTPREIAEQYLAGESIKALAEQHGIPYSTVQRWLKRQGTPMRKPGYRVVKDGPKGELAREYEAGATAMFLAEREGVSLTTMYRLLREQNAQMRRHGGARR